MSVGKFEQVKDSLRNEPKKWLVTGCAGFIGSNLLQELLHLGQKVVGLDNFSTGYQTNIDEAIAEIKNPDFTMIEGDIRDAATCVKACEGVDYVLHQAALGSVPRSIDDPVTSNDVNVGGFVNMALAVRDCGVKRFVYASSSSVYGDSTVSPKAEKDTGHPLSPYAITKAVDELYARVFHQLYGIQAIGLRYFNVFGRRQDPNGAYAAVIPRWIGILLSGQGCSIYGDGLTTRDFCYIQNVVQANILAATVTYSEDFLTGYNVSCGDETSLNELYSAIQKGLVKRLKKDFPEKPYYTDFRQGDVRKSLADISAISRDLGYRPQYNVSSGMEEALDWYVAHLGKYSV